MRANIYLKDMRVIKGVPFEIEGDIIILAARYQPPDIVPDDARKLWLPLANVNFLEIVPVGQRDV